MEIHRASHSKDERHDIFSHWIFETMLGLKDSEALATKQTRRVIDVGGGKGFLSHALVDLGIRCALVDPCAKTGRELGSAGFFNPYCQKCDNLCAEGPVSTDDAVISNDSEIDKEIEKEPLVVLQRTLQQVVESRLHLIHKCLALVGLHPDEATEAIIDTALSLNLPFAVIPCCVTPQLFPNRVLKRKVHGYSSSTSTGIGTNVRVKKYGSFISYLMDKDPRIRRTELPFKGRNMVLYMTAQDYLARGELIEYQHKRPPPDCRPCAAAAKAGNLTLLQVLRESGHPWNAECAQAAAWGGHLHVLRWLLESGCPFDHTAYDAAVKAHHTDIIAWLVLNVRS